MLSKSIRRLTLAALIASTSALGTAQAQTWNLNNNGSWNTAANWNPASVPNGAAAIADLGLNITAARAITLDAAITVGSLTIGDTNTTHAYALSNGTGTGLTFDNSGTTAILNQASTSIGDTISASMLTVGDLNITNLNTSGTARTLTLSGTLSASSAGTKTVTFGSSSANAPVTSSGIISDGTGVVSLIKTGSGVLTLSGLNTYTGGTTLDTGGIINLNAGSTTGGGAVVSGPLGRGTVLVKTGTTLRTNSSTARTINNIVTFQGSVTTGSASTGALTIDPTQVTGGVTTIDGAVTLTVSGANLNLTGRVVGINAPSLTKAGGQDLVVSNATGTASSFGNLTVNTGRVFFTGATTAAVQDGIGANTSTLTATGSGGIIFNTTGAFTVANPVAQGTGGRFGARTSAITLSNSPIPATGGTMIYNQDDQTSTALTINGATPTLTGALTIQTGGGSAATVGNVTFGGTFNNGGNLITLDTRTATTTASALILNGIISGAGGLTKTSNASTANTTAILGGANTYDGVTTVNIGTLRINSDTALGSIVGGTVVNAGGTLSQNSAGPRTISGEALTINGTGPTGGLAGALHVGSNSILNYNGPITVASASTIAVNGGSTLNTDAMGTINLGANTLTIQTDGSTSSTLSGAISGATGSLVKNGGATLVLNATNTYGGTTTVNGGVLAATTLASLPGYNVAGTITVNTGGTLRVPTGTWTATDIDTLRTNTNFNTGGNLGLDTTAGDFSYGNLTDVSNVAGNVGLTKSGINTLTLTGTNTYTGTTTITGGTLTTAANFASPALVFNGGTFLYQPGSGFDLSVTSVPGPRTITMTGAGTIDTNGNNVSFANPVGAGAGALTKAGLGTLTFNAASTYTGTTIIGQGTLALGVDHTMTGGLTFGASAGSTTVSTLDTASAGGGAGVNATFGAVTVRTNNATANTLTIAPTKTVTFGSLTMGYDAGGGSGQNPSNLTVTGGGNLIVNGATITLSVNQAATNVGYSSSATLDVSALGSFTASPTTTLNIGVGSNQSGPGTLILSNTANTITTPQIQVGNTGSNNGAGASFMTLGAGTNVLNANTFNIGFGKTSGTIAFANTTAGPGSATFRGAAGGVNPVTTMNLGSHNGTGTGNNIVGTVDLRGKTADLLATTINMGTQNQTSTGSATGNLLIDTGTITATTINAGRKSSTGSGAANGNITFGGTAIANITTLTLGTNSATSGSNSGTGTLNVSGGTTTVGTLNLGVKSGAQTANAVGIVNVSGGSLIVNTAFSMVNQATAGNANATVNITGGTLTSNVDILEVAGNGTSTITLNGGTLDMMGKNIGGATPINVLNFNSGTLRNVAEINNGAGLTKSGTGVLILDGTNTYTGGTFINGGVLQFNTNMSALPAAPTPGITINAPGTLGINFAGVQAIINSKVITSSTGAVGLYAGVNNTENVDFSATGANLTGAFLGAVGNVTYQAPAVLTPNGTTYRLGGLAGTLTYKPALVGANDLVIGGNVILDDTNANTYSGGTTITQGTLTIASDASLGVVPGVPATNLNINGGAGLSITSPSVTLNANRSVVLNTGAANLDSNGNVLTIAGDISGAGGVNKIGLGSLTLTGNNTFTGTSTVTAGTLIAGTSNALAGSTFDYNNQGGTFSFGTLTTATFGGLSGAQSLALMNTTPAAVALTVGGNNTSTAYTGVLSGVGGSLIKNGTGTLTLGGAAANTYTGLTTVNGGTLTLNTPAGIDVMAGDLLVTGGTVNMNADNQLPDTTNITVNSGLFRFASGTNTSRNETVATITINGPGDVNTANGTITSPTTVIVTGTITVNADSMVTGSGLAVNSGSNLIANKVIYNGGQENVIGGNNAAQVNTLTVGVGGLEFTGGQLKMNLGTVGRLGSSLILNGDVTSFAAATDAGVFGSTTSDTNGTRTIDIGSGTRTFTVADGIAVNDLRLDYDLINTGSIVKAGPGLMRLNGTNSYTGGASINAGTLQFTRLVSMPVTGVVAVGTGGTLAVNIGGTGEWTTGTSGEGTIGGLLSGLGGQTGSTVTYTGAVAIGLDTSNAVPTTQTYASVIGNVGTSLGITKLGANSLELSGANTYGGGTNVNAGTLLVNNTTGSGTGTGAVNVAALATLGGTGTISGLTSVVSTGVISPNTTGTIGTLTLNGGLTTTGASLVFDLSTPASSDKIDLGATGILTSTGGMNAFTFAGTPSAGTYTLIDYGTFSGVLADFTAPAMVNGLNATLSDDTGIGAIVLTLAPAGPDQWIGTGNWTTTANWQGAVPNSATAVASFLGMGTGAVTVDAPQTVNQIVFNAATPSYTIGGTSVLSVAGTTPSITNTTGSNTITAPLNLANGTAINVTAGTLAISPTTANTVGTGVNATVAASATLTLGGTANALNSTTNIANAGSLSVSGTAQTVGNISGAGSTTVSGAGTSVTPTLVANDIDQASLTISNGAYVRLAASGTNTSVVTSLTMGTTANLDINDNDMVVNNPTPVAAASSLTAVATAVNAGFAGGNGIVTTTTGLGLETVGFGLNSFLSYPTFNGVAVNDDSVLIKYTYFGDSNLDGFVTDDDLGYFLAGYGSDISANPWILGDYNHDGFTTDDDLGFFLAAYGSTPGLAGGGIQAIPEPSTLVLGTLAGLGLGALSLRRRRAK